MNGKAGVASDGASPAAALDVQQARPVFVVGMNGSGTTMLLDCLGRHPGLYAFPRETRLLPYLMAREAGYGDLTDDARFARLWDEVRNLDVFRLVNGGQPVPLPEDWRARERSLAAIIDSVFRYFAAQSGKQRWCEKTPQHVQHMLALAQRFPRARFIHVVRDGRDCAVSFHRRWKRQPELTLFRWKKVVAAGRSQGQQLGAASYLEVHYEQLTAEPENSLRRICAFLDLPFDPAVLESAQPYLQGAEGSGRGLLRNSGKWQRYFAPSRLARLERIAGRTLAAFGYANASPDADEEPPSWQRRWWTVMEIRRQYSREIGLKLRGEIARPWSAILVKPLNALRQRRHNDY